MILDSTLNFVFFKLLIFNMLFWSPFLDDCHGPCDKERMSYILLIADRCTDYGVDWSWSTLLPSFRLKFCRGKGFQRIRREGIRCNPIGWDLLHLYILRCNPIGRDLQLLVNGTHLVKGIYIYILCTEMLMNAYLLMNQFEEVSMKK